MRRKNLGLAVTLTATALAPACGAVATGPSAVTGGVWRLHSLETPAGGLEGISRPQDYTLEFQDAGRLGVKADCNVCGGTYSISGPSLQINALACTRAFCGDASKDTAFLDILTSARSLGVRGIELTIDSPKGTLRLNR